MGEGGFCAACACVGVGGLLLLGAVRSGIICCCRREGMRAWMMDDRFLKSEIRVWEMGIIIGTEAFDDLTT